MTFVVSVLFCLCPLDDALGRSHDQYGERFDVYHFAITLESANGVRYRQSHGKTSSTDVAATLAEALTVHWEETKTHYPNSANDGIKYEGFHYVVSLPDEVTAKPENADLKDLRCEVQIQTLLADAFAESSHDIIYKGNVAPRPAPAHHSTKQAESDVMIQPDNLFTTLSVDTGWNR